MVFQMKKEPFRKIYINIYMRLVTHVDKNELFLVRTEPKYNAQIGTSLHVSDSEGPEHQ